MILAELTRAKALFQMRTIQAVIAGPFTPAPIPPRALVNPCLVCGRRIPTGDCNGISGDHYTSCPHKQALVGRAA